MYDLYLCILKTSVVACHATLSGIPNPYTHTYTQVAYLGPHDIGRTMTSDQILIHFMQKKKEKGKKKRHYTPI